MPGDVLTVYALMLGITWWASGLSYAVAALLPPENGMMTGEWVQGDDTPCVAYWLPGFKVAS